MFESISPRSFVQDRQLLPLDERVYEWTGLGTELMTIYGYSKACCIELEKLKTELEKTYDEFREIESVQIVVWKFQARIKAYISKYGYKHCLSGCHIECQTKLIDGVSDIYLILRKLAMIQYLFGRIEVLDTELEIADMKELKAMVDFLNSLTIGLQVMHDKRMS